MERRDKECLEQLELQRTALRRAVSMSRDQPKVPTGTLDAAELEPAPETAPADGEQGRIWTLVLAAGEGRRMLEAVKHVLGEARPKQYCTFVGTRSMLEHALDRARSISGVERIVTVIGSGHRGFLAEALCGEAPGRIVEQPRDRGTGPGVFLPMTYVLEQEPEATLLILPADHFVYPEERFVRLLHEACDLAAHSGQLVLIGARPQCAETDYGWILPDYAAGATDGHGPVAARSVAEFREKPDRAAAEELFRRGGLWSTMIVAVQAKVLWELGWLHARPMMERFDTFRQVLHAVRAERVAVEHEALGLAALYRELGPLDFSRDLLGPAARASSVVALEGIEWSDWGRPERVRETLARYGVLSRWRLDAVDSGKVGVAPPGTP